MPALNFERFVEPLANSNFNVTPSDFLHVLRLPGWFFMGIDMVSLTVEEVQNEREVVPWAMVGIISTKISLAFWLLFTVASQAPGLSHELYGLGAVFPLSFEFSNLFNISQTSAALLAVLRLMSSCIAYLFAVGRQLNSMAWSGLFPPLLKKTMRLDKIPLNAMLVGSLLGLIGLLFA
jgi:amino acid transporter